MLLVQEDLRHSGDRLARLDGQIVLGQPFGVDVHVAEFEVIALLGQLLGDLLGTDTVGATRATKNFYKHRFSPLNEAVI
ncbi:hypothetical protein D3C80_2075990 [compost metagenome]